MPVLWKGGLKLKWMVFQTPVSWLSAWQGLFLAPCQCETVSQAQPPGGSLWGRLDLEFGLDGQANLKHLTSSTLQCCDMAAKRFDAESRQTLGTMVKLLVGMHTFYITVPPWFDTLFLYFLSSFGQNAQILGPLPLTWETQTEFWVPDSVLVLSRLLWASEE